MDTEPLAHPQVYRAPPGTRQPEGVQDSAKPRRRRVYAACAVAAALSLAALIWGVHRNSPRTLVSFHGMFHAAVTQRFLPPQESSFPPENPLYAGRPLCYYWFFHYLAAGVARATGWDVFHAMEALALVGAAALVGCSAALAHALYRNALAGLLIAYLVLAGANPFGWVIGGVKVAANGIESLQDDPTHLWNVVHPLYSLVRYNDTGALYGPLLNFSFNVSSRGPALAALLGMSACLWWLLRQGGAAPYLVLAAATALTTALSPIVGIAGGGAVACGMLALWGRSRWLPNGPRDGLVWPRGRALGAVVAIAAGVLISGPTYFHLITGPSDSHLSIAGFPEDGIKHCVTVVLSIGPLLCLAALGCRKACGLQRSYLASLILGALLLLGGDLVFRLPPGNHSNFFHAAAVLLSVPAAACVLTSPTGAKQAAISPIRTAAMVAFFLPTAVLVTAAYLNRPPLPLEFKGPAVQRLPAGSSLARAYEWVERDTEPDAVFIVDPRPSESYAMCGNTSEFPAMTGRVIFVDNARHYAVSPYEGAEARFQLAKRLLAGEGPTAEDIARLKSLARPVYLVSTSAGDQGLLARFAAHYGRPVFRDAHCAVFAVVGQRRE